ncbi:pyrroline-5-carboxylate reductase [Amedibacillus sp. YH-ame10]
MMNKKIGFIGSGNMGGAMIGGIIKADIVSKNNIYVSDINEQSLESMKASYGVNVTTDNVELAKECDIIVLSVKPFLYPIVINEIKNVVKENVIIVVIAAGQSSATVQKLFDRDVKIVKTMPNTPALVGEGMAAISPSSNVTKEETAEIVAIFNSFGKSEIVPEKLMDAVTAVSGSSPAYIYMLIEAMADAAVVEGMPRPQAYAFAAQAVYGSAKMVMETGKHPGELKDMVCSPGGTTIAAVAKLEETGFRSSIMQAMKACADKSKMMSE